MTLSDEECYLRLRDAIIREKYLPNERLVEMDISHSLGVGRAAVRTALARLEIEGLVERERYRGAHVRLISDAEAIELLEARAMLESLAARYAAEKVTETESVELFGFITEMGRCIESGDLLGSSEVNNRMHQMLLRIANHTTANRLLNMLKPQQVRYRYRTILVPGRPDHSYQEHREIVEAVTSRDPDRAEQAMRRHLTQVSEALKQIIRVRRISDEGDGE